ncbi:MAG: DUF2878 domain-containing protein [Burkholderiales bacterium]|nr:DUF2878 domain-containing protein [Burkholderiales bacterium]
MNFLAYQVGWFSTVLGAAHGIGWLGPLFVGGLTYRHVILATDRRAEITMLVIVTFAGCLFDQLMLTAGWVSYPASDWPASLLPVWMVGLWLSFATTLNVSTRWLHKRSLLALLLGAIGGPLAYAGGARLGAMSWSPDHPVGLALGVGIGLLLPFQCLVAAKFDGFGERLT